MRRRQSDRRAATCAVLLAALVACGSVQAADGSDAHAIQALLDANRAAEGETRARAAIAAAEAAGRPDEAATANLYRLLGDALFNQKRLAEAEPAFRRALAMRTSVLGRNHLDTARSAGDLAITLRGLGRYDESEIFYRQALETRQRLLGADHADVARSWYRLARLLDASGDHAKAAATMGEAVSVGEKALGRDDPTVIEWRGERAAMLFDAGDLGAAEPAYREVIAAAENVPDVDALALAGMRQGLARLFERTGRLAEADRPSELALASRRNMLPPDDPAVRSSLSFRGSLLMKLDRPAEAETLYRALLASIERMAGPDSAEAADAARRIANAAQRQQRDVDAEIFFKRALAISERLNGRDDLLTALDMLALGTNYAGQQRFREAEPLLARAVAVIDGIDSARSTAVAARTALAFLKSSLGEQEAAIAEMERARQTALALEGADSGTAAGLAVSMAFVRLRIGETAQALGLAREAAGVFRRIDPDGRGFVRTLTIEGSAALAERRYADARRFFTEAVNRLEKRYGEGSFETRSPVADLGTVAFAMDDYDAAAAWFEKAVAMSETIAAIDARAAFGNRAGSVEDDAVAHAAIYDYLVKTYDRLARKAPRDADRRAEQAFAVAQRVIGSRAAAALKQMSLRQTAAGGALAAHIRERQDLVARWQREDARLTGLLAAADRDRSAVEALRTALGGIDARIKAIDRRMEADFPTFADLQNPAAVTVAEVQASLAENEVLLFYADTNRLADSGFETFLWAVPKRGTPRWIRLEPEAGALSAMVRELRGAMRVGPQARGAVALGAEADSRADTVIAAGRALYDAVLAPVKDMIAGKDLVIVPSGKLSGVPFHLLVSSPPAAGSPDAYRDAGWLARAHAITVLPSVAALPQLRGAGSRSDTRDAYLGFANPLLVGRDGSDRRAFERRRCAPSSTPVAVAAADLPEVGSLFRGAGGDVEAIRLLPPLPETTDEACALAAALGGDEAAVRIGADATEGEVKRLSEDGRLGRARIVHFATHGLVAGDLAGLSEPALVLTPPALASGADDGLLTASEVTTLKLDADWVILSACNTAAGDGGGEALSGLTRAFFYAGARAMLVSHWPVNSDAAVSLVTHAIGEIAADPSLGRAEALRRAMVAEIDKGGSHADPANWAPFILVGASH